MVEKKPKTLYWHVNQVLETYAPRGLYGRALAIMITPVVLLQLVMGGIIIERYWDNVTKVLSRALSNEIGLLINLYEKSDRSETALRELEALAFGKLRMKLRHVRNRDLPQVPATPLFSIFDARITHYLNSEFNRKYWVNSQAPDGQVEIQVEVEKGLIFVATVDADRAHAVGTPLMLAFMIVSTLSLLGIAVVFMRNQIRPILDLTQAAQALGMGRDVVKFRPRGATEVRLAGEAFLEMKRRIARHVEQRTTMLAGVSHDLRTILTRFRLELAAFGDNPKVKPLRDDVSEMQQMLEDYMAFVRGDGGEKVAPIDLSSIVNSVAQSFGRDGKSIEVSNIPQLELQLKPNAFRRLIMNIISNAVRYGSAVRITGEAKDDRVWLYVDDNGPGIPETHRDDVFRPFVRLDEARNLDKSGTGLGLAIALDIAQAHGGDIYLQDSPLGGLRVAIKIPI